MGVYFFNAVGLSFRAYLFLIFLGRTVAAAALIHFSATSTAFRQQKRQNSCVFQPFFLHAASGVAQRRLFEGGCLFNSMNKITGRLFRGGVILSIYGKIVIFNTCNY